MNAERRRGQQCAVTVTDLCIDLSMPCDARSDESTQRSGRGCGQATNVSFATLRSGELEASEVVQRLTRCACGLLSKTAGNRR